MNIYIYMYRYIQTYQLWYTLLGTEFLFLFLFFFHASRALGGASVSYFDYSMSPYDEICICYAHGKVCKLCG